MDEVNSPKNKSEVTYRILVVDDEEDARELFVELLSTVSHYEVSGAIDGIDALAKAESQKFDLILLDIVMPRKDGVQVLSELRADKGKYGSPTIVMLTNIGGDLAIEEAMKLGADGYKLKIDTEPEGLLKYTEEILKNKSKDGDSEGSENVTDKGILGSAEDNSNKKNEMAKDDLGKNNPDAPSMERPTGLL